MAGEPPSGLHDGSPPGADLPSGIDRGRTERLTGGDRCGKSPMREMTNCRWDRKYRFQRGFPGKSLGVSLVSILLFPLA